MPQDSPTTPFGHSHVFLSEAHASSERRTWAVIWLCAAMMLAEILGGILFGSIALVADGLHMSTHAGALLLAALAYRYARIYAHDARFTFGTGKLGDLAGFTSAIVLAGIALLIGYEAVSRLFAPVPIRFAEAIPIAGLGLVVNVVSAWLLSGGEHHHHGHGHHHHAEEGQRIAAGGAVMILDVFEDGVPPRFRLRPATGPLPAAAAVTITTERPDGTRQAFALEDRGPYLQSIEEIPEPHQFLARVRVGSEEQEAVFEEHDHASHAAHRDNNMRAAVIHVAADAAVSVLVILGLLLARTFGWLWVDPLAGIVGALVIAAWSYGLIRDTGAILLDMNPDRATSERLRQTIERDGDSVTDLHLWRIGPGHLGAILSVATTRHRGPDYYRDRLARFDTLSHVTIEVDRPAGVATPPRRAADRPATPVAPA